MKSSLRKKPRPCKTYRLRVGRLADGREAFALAGYCVSALGSYRYADVWVRSSAAWGGAHLHMKRDYAGPGSPAYRETFAAIVQGTDKRSAGDNPGSHQPATRLDQLGSEGLTNVYPLRRCLAAGLPQDGSQ